MANPSSADVSTYIQREISDIISDVIGDGQLRYDDETRDDIVNKVVGMMAHHFPIVTELDVTRVSKTEMSVAMTSHVIWPLQ